MEPCLVLHSQWSFWMPLPVPGYMCDPSDSSQLELKVYLTP